MVPALGIFGTGGIACLRTEATAAAYASSLGSLTGGSTSPESLAARVAFAKAETEVKYLWMAQVSDKESVQPSGTRPQRHRQVHHSAAQPHWPIGQLELIRSS